MKISVEQTYTSIACNRSPEIVDWNSDGLLCFGACNAVAVYDTKIIGKDPHTILSHHRGRVNCVKWLRKPDGTSTELVSCSADKTAAIWSLEDGQWKLTSTLVGHTNAVTCVYGFYAEDDVLVVYTTSVDSTIRVWERRNGETQLKQAINLNSGLCLTLHACLLPVVKKPILFCALDDHKVHIFVEDKEYHRVHTLSGHEDWVRGLDALAVDSKTILLASSSQDTYIRLWRIQLHEEQPQNDGPAIKAEEKVFLAHDKPWSVKLDAVLAGHEGWVYGVQWHPCKIDIDTKGKQPIFRLLSSSLDKTLIIWEPEVSPLRSAGEGAGEGAGAWVERVRVGEVGGNGLGFYGSRFGPEGKAILGHGYNGSFHIWKVDKSGGEWSPRVVPGGHFGAVLAARWEPRGRYLASVSADQTTRVHAPWNRNGGVTSWHELARPQVHGYDMSSIALVTGSVLASSAEEKVVRVFRATHNFVQNFESIVGDTIEEANGQGPQGASVPSLGLSNKAVFDDTSDIDADNDGYFVPVLLTEPPTEEHLMQNSLWAETHKLYGHGYEVWSLAATNDSTLLATVCKATTAEHACVILWETKTWQQIQKLPSHQLTVTQLEFSPDSQRLLTVSRDRRWSVFQRREGSNLFDLAARTDKNNGVHTRIIWCCAWAHDGGVFATGSRDGKVCVWTKTENDSASSLGPYSLLKQPLEVPNSSVTAVTFAPLTIDGARIIVTGFESGVIRIYSFKDEWSLLKEMDNSAAHHLTVNRVQFRPNCSHELMLASCGADHMLRIYTLTVI